MVEAVFLWYRIVIHKSIINLKCMLVFFKKLFLPAFLLKDRDIELNPDPNNWSHFHFSCCQQNVNSLTRDENVKLSAHKAYNVIHKCGLKCVTEAVRDSCIKSDSQMTKILLYTGII